MEKLTEEEFYRKVRELAKLYRAAGFSKRDSFSRARSNIKDQFARAGRSLGRVKSGVKENDT